MSILNKPFDKSRCSLLTGGNSQIHSFTRNVCTQCVKHRICLIDAFIFFSLEFFERIIFLSSDNLPYVFFFLTCLPVFHHSVLTQGHY